MEIAHPSLLKAAFLNEVPLWFSVPFHEADNTRPEKRIILCWWDFAINNGEIEVPVRLAEI